ncbi:hypothetical protein GCM10010218_30290 [Streptomyces mashuensis]|uniref:Histidine kinase/HSP90-like ATPase domain-containing protein n=1 Tax=Streptomyces mashuensis TaxID=33904 RepID=A0A919B3J5_9ACTN|nr:ATP-binding protein [Streptomyces mashuensis]GHF46945.1 hypothetical protein GCM10010218_30290 [Streptomyces mashuensis]
MSPVTTVPTTRTGGAAFPPRSDFSLVFPPAPAWVRGAREAVRTALLIARREELVPMAMLLTSEVVTNAVNACRRHRCSVPVTVTVSWMSGGALLVLVYDGAPGVPEAYDARARAEEERGRGLLLVRACAADWGVCRGPGQGPGKAVWFRLVS